MHLEVREKTNGFSFKKVDGPEEFGPVELVVEGKDPLKIGAAVLVLFKKPRKSPVRKGAVA
jgi:hypothetical protein